MASGFRPRRGSVLLLVLFLMAITAPLVGMLLDTHTTHLRCVHNHVEGLAALYVAEAGVQRAVAELLANPSWRAGFTDEKVSPDLAHTFTVTLADTPEGEIEIASTSQTAGGYAKTVTACVRGF